MFHSFIVTSIYQDANPQVSCNKIVNVIKARYTPSQHPSPALIRSVRRCFLWHQYLICLPAQLKCILMKLSANLYHEYLRRLLDFLKSPQTRTGSFSCRFAFKRLLTINRKSLFLFSSVNGERSTSLALHLLFKAARLDVLMFPFVRERVKTDYI